MFLIGRRMGLGVDSATGRLITMRWVLQPCDPPQRVTFPLQSWVDRSILISGIRKYRRPRMSMMLVWVAIAAGGLLGTLLGLYKL